MKNTGKQTCLHSHAFYSGYHFHSHLFDLHVYILSNSIPGQGRKGPLGVLSSPFL